MSKKSLMNEIVALDAALDTLVFGKPLGLFGEKATKEDAEKVARLCKKVATREDSKPTPSIIGRKIHFRDNSSHTINLTTGQKDGNVFLFGTTMEVISEPYAKEVKKFLSDEMETITMVKVRSFDTGMEYEVPFTESALCDENGVSYWEAQENKDAESRKARYGF